MAKSKGQLFYCFLTKHNFNKDYLQEKKEIMKCVHDAIL
jgi:hypothetical protein